MRGGPTGGERVRTVFLGSGSFGAPSLRRLAAHPPIEIVGIVTAPDRPVGRRREPTSTPIGTLAAQLGLAPVLVPERLRDAEAIESVLALSPMLAVLVDYGQIVPSRLLDLPHGALNLHPSALPRWRGASPISATILAGDTATAVTLMKMDNGLDTGPVVAQEPLALAGDETAPELEARLAAIGAALLVRSLEAWLRGELRARPQATDGVTISRPLRREDGRLDASRPAIDLERQVRAYLPWPGSFLEAGGARLVVTAASVAPSGNEDVVGRLVRHGDRPALTTAKGRLVLDAVTPPGRRPMSGASYLLGRPGPA